MAEKVAVETIQETEERPKLDQRETNHAPEEEAARPVQQRRRGLLASSQAKFIFALILIVLIVGGYFLMRYFGSYEDTDDAQVYGHLMPLSARISGYVQKVNVDDNQYVTKGTVLVEIDPRDYQVAVEQAQAQLADAEANANSLNLECSHYQRQYDKPIEFFRVRSGLGARRCDRSPEAGCGRPSGARPSRGKQCQGSERSDAL